MVKAVQVPQMCLFSISECQTRDRRPRVRRSRGLQVRGRREEGWRMRRALVLTKAKGEGAEVGWLLLEARGWVLLGGRVSENDRYSSQKQPLIESSWFPTTPSGCV